MSTVIQIDPSALTKTIIPVFEEVLDQQFNEETIKALVAKHPELVKALEAVNKREVIIGEVGDKGKPGVTFSQWLGDLARKSRGEGPAFAKEQNAFIPCKTNIDPAYVASLAPEVKSLYEATDASGGYLVPTEESRQLLDLTSAFEVVPGLCTVVPMRTNQITFPTLTTGLVAYWIPESQSISGSGQSEGEKQASDPVFGQMTITAHVLAVLVYVSNQLLDDSDPAIDRVLYSLFAKTLGRYFSIACLRGAGTTTDPVTGLNGLITTNALNCGAQFNFDDVLDVIYSPLDNSHGATTTIDVLGHTKAERKLLKVKDSDGQYVFKMPADKTKGIPTIWTEPWRRDNNIATNLGTGSNETRIYSGDFQNYAYVGNRMSVVIKANPWGNPQFTRNMTAFLAEFRKGFNVSDESLFAKMDGVPTT